MDSGAYKYCDDLDAPATLFLFSNTENYSQCFLSIQLVWR